MAASDLLEERSPDLIALFIGAIPAARGILIHGHQPRGADAIQARPKRELFANRRRRQADGTNALVGRPAVAKIAQIDALPLLSSIVLLQPAGQAGQILAPIEVAIDQM